MTESHLNIIFQPNIIHPSPEYRHNVSKFGLTLCSVVLWRFRPTLGFGPGPGFWPSVGRRGSTPRLGPGPGAGPRPGGRLWLASSGGSGLGLGLRLGPGSGVGAGPGTAVVVAAPGSGTASAPGAAAATSAATRTGWTAVVMERSTSVKQLRAHQNKREANCYRIITLKAVPNKVV